MVRLVDLLELEARQVFWLAEHGFAGSHL